MCAAATEPVVLLAAGGTGGHLFPALALAQELGRRKVTVDLVTDSRGDRYGSTFPARSTYTIRSATHAGWSPLSAARAAMNLTWGTSAAFRLLGRIRPSAVIGFGGYPTLPPLAAAALRKIPAAVHEQNAVLGRANRLMRARASAIATSFAETRFVEPNLSSKTYLTGNPVRDIVIEWSAKPYRPASNGEPFRVVVFGGSQGARFLSDVVPEALLALAEPLRTRLEVTQQCRAEDLERVQAVYTRGGIKSELAPFFGNLPERLASAHLVIGRAGASTVAELT